MKKRLLLNFVYWMPVGHVVEALKYTKGFIDSNRGIEVYVAINSASTPELLNECSWIKGVYPVNVEEIWKYGEKAKSFVKIPKEWDYIVTDKRSKKLADSGYEQKMKKYHLLVQNNFIAYWKGYTDSWYSEGLPRGLSYKQNSRINIKVPKHALKYIKKRLKKDKFRIVVLLAGSADAGEYPTIDSWIYILKEIKKIYPEVSFYITGVMKSENGRTSTSAYSEKEINKLFSETDAVNCYNIGLWNQIALVEESDIFFSPHTGFAFLAMCVNTPWLVLSGGNWPEYIFNDVPFYSILPKSKEYPFYASKINFKDLDSNTKRKVSKMDQKGVNERMHDIIKGIKLLRNKAFTYNKAVKEHVKNIDKAGINKKALFWFDRIQDFN